MEYLYGALLLHSAGKEVTVENVKGVLKGAGVTPDEARIKAMVAALEGIDIKAAIEKAAFAPVASAAP
ncbi:MAG: 50S ribosomal protein P1, partial [Candidatus Aenigmarchaeota archaeon]|nr:50S ribosomal protein P1 [Candidatus Aenigmarchaeota archaeon]